MLLNRTESNPLKCGHHVFTRYDYAEKARTGTSYHTGLFQNFITPKRILQVPIKNAIHIPAYSLILFLLTVFPFERSALLDRGIVARKLFVTSKVMWYNENDFVNLMSNVWGQKNGTWLTKVTLHSAQLWFSRIFYTAIYKMDLNKANYWLPSNTNWTEDYATIIKQCNM